MNELNCLRCGHKWYQRIPGRPKLCPSCKSKYWDQERDDEKTYPKKLKKIIL